MKSEHLIMYECFFCENDFAFGPDVYEGGHYRPWMLEYCHICKRASWDGIGPMHETKLLEHLSTLQVPAPLRNSKGLIICPF